MATHQLSRLSHCQLHRQLPYALSLSASPCLPLLPLIVASRWQSTASAVRTTQTNKVNGPATTLPALLVVHQRGKDEGLISFAYKRGKGYLSFYKTGVKNVWYNYRQARTIRHLLPKSPGESTTLSRADYQLIHRSAHDIRRVLPFALLFLLVGEYTPFVVPFLPGLVPRPCWIPTQIQKDRERLQKRRLESFRALTAPPPSGDSVGEEDLSREQLLHISRSLNLHSRWYPDALLPLPPTPILRARVRRHVQYLSRDDDLIVRDGGIGAMEAEEVRMALLERGVDTLGVGDGHLRALLGEWIGARKELGTPTLKLLLTRPSVWPKK